MTEWALQLLDEVRQKGLQSNVITYSTLVSAYGKITRTQRALQLFGERGSKPSDNKFTYFVQLRLPQPEVITYAAASVPERAGWQRVPCSSRQIRLQGSSRV